MSTEGSVAGLMIDSLNHLHFYLDGEDIGTETKGIPRPCYALVKFKHQMKVGSELHSVFFSANAI